MAFESLQEKFQSIFKKMRREDKLTDSNMEQALKEIRLALLESDVNFKVVKAFTNDLKEKAKGEEVIRTVHPSEMLVKLCHQEIVEMLGKDNSEIFPKKGKLTMIMLVGLQGTGKTTHAGKLGLLFKKKYGLKVLLAGLDIYRPAAIDQLKQIADSLQIDFFTMGKDVNPVVAAKKAQEKALNEHYDVLILDTAGRLQIDETLMEELQNINKEVKPEEILLLVDAMAGQEATNVVLAFNEKLPLTGVIMSKLDGDAKGGAALSLKYLTGLPIKYAGVGEKLEDIEVFHPDRLADRILGMGDIVTLVEKAQEQIDQKEAERTGRKMMEGEYTLEDLLSSMKMMQKIGSIKFLSKMMPGLNKLSDSDKERAEKEMKIFESVINSMTPYERRHPEILKFSHKNRIARGSGTTNADINRVIKKFEQSKAMMKQVNAYRKKGKMPPGFGGI